MSCGVWSCTWTTGDTDTASERESNATRFYPQMHCSTGR
jgi:hypothetical protein